MTQKRHFDADLDDLRALLLRMGSLCEEMIQYAVKVIVERDAGHVAAVQEWESQVNLLHIEIDEVCLKLIALHQPAAGDLRFIGATLLHILSSSAIGVALGLAFYRPWRARFMAGLWGLLAAMCLHVVFNILILNAPKESLLAVFSLVWIGIIALLAVLEYIKRIRRA